MAKPSKKMVAALILNMIRVASKIAPKNELEVNITFNSQLKRVNIKPVNDNETILSIGTFSEVYLRDGNIFVYFDGRAVASLNVFTSVPDFFGGGKNRDMSNRHCLGFISTYIEIRPDFIAPNSAVTTQMDEEEYMAFNELLFNLLLNHKKYAEWTS